VKGCFCCTDRRVDAMALNRTLQHLTQADDNAAATEVKMASQTERMERLASDLEKINSNLDETDRTMSGMQRSYFGNALNKGFASLGSGIFKDAAQKSTSESEPVGAALMEGWLYKRGPTYSHKWQQRWCVLYPDVLVYYTSQKGDEQKGQVPIGANSQATAFGSSRASGDAIRHRGERPAGFVVDPDATGGPDRRLFYFDAEASERCKMWTRAIERAAAALRPGEPCEVRRPEEPLQQINSVLDTLHGRALNINTEIARQGASLQRASDGVDSAQGRMNTQIGRAQGL